MSKENIEIVKKINDAFAANNVEGFLENCSESVSWTMVGDRTVQGKDAIRGFMSEMAGSEPPVFGVDRMIANDDSVVCYGDMTMKDGDGKTSDWSYCDIYHFTDGKVVEMASYVIKKKGAGDTTESAAA
ncbi:nuclear transport factor 2 family protein [Leptolyngbya sp. 7M]|uniref:nuclear transport factor 2 family protein n=1 Tax=Leptolyngbya sp. 7M TaxID=2812896 RepID=UPI001B8D4A2D|nr:nuclear transport factor 2 family protein [Leptolyngbya sp. 7M]QYO66803.1 nuclear transport factor 2 family protein [Leptolyngbya sp. 7M]